MRKRGISEKNLDRRGFKPKLVQKHPLQEVGAFTAVGAAAALWRELESDLQLWVQLFHERAFREATDVMVKLLKRVPFQSRPPEWKQWKSKIRRLSKVAKKRLQEALDIVAAGIRRST